MLIYESPESRLARMCAGVFRVKAEHNKLLYDEAKMAPEDSFEESTTLFNRQPARHLPSLE